MAGRNLERLRAKIERRIAARQRALERRIRETEKHMANAEQRLRRMAASADFVYAELVRDRVRVLAEYLPGARFEASAERRLARVVIGQDTPFPAHYTVTLSVEIDPPAGSIVLVSHREVIPDHGHFSTRRTLRLPWDNVDLDDVVHWIENELLIAFETCQRIEQHPEYRRGTEVTDPVCGMRFSYLDAAESVSLDGRTYHFCAPSCAERFRKEPDRYRSAPPAWRRVDPMALTPEPEDGDGPGAEGH